MNPYLPLAWIFGLTQLFFYVFPRQPADAFVVGLGTILWGYTIFRLAPPLRWSARRILWGLPLLGGLILVSSLVQPAVRAFPIPALILLSGVLLAFTASLLAPPNAGARLAIARATALAAAFSVIASLIRNRGIDVFPLQWLHSMPSGNPNMTSALLMSGLIAAAFLWREEVTVRNKVLFAVLPGFFFALYIPLCQTRATWLWMLLAGPVLLWIERRRIPVWFSAPRNRRSLLWGGAAALILTAILLQPGLRRFPEGLRLRISTLTRPNAVQVEMRPLMWRNSLRLIRDHGFLGVGTGNFRQSYPRYSTLDERALFANVAVENPHNDPLFFSAESGVAAGLLFLGLLLVSAVRLWRNHRRWESAILGYHAFHGLFFINFHESVFLLLLWPILGMGLSDLSAPRENGAPPSGNPFRLRLAILSASLLIGSLLILSAANDHRLLRRSHLPPSSPELPWPCFEQWPAKRGVSAFEAGKNLTAVQCFQKSLAFGPWQADVRVLLSDLYRRMGQRQEAIDQARESLRINPVEVRAAIELGLLWPPRMAIPLIEKVLLQESSPVIPESPEVYPVYENLCAQSGYRPDNRRVMGRFLLGKAFVLRQSGKPREALDLLRQVPRMDSSLTKDAQFESARSWISAGRFDNALTLTQTLYQDSSLTRKDKALAAYLTSIAYGGQGLWNDAVRWGETSIALIPRLRTRQRDNVLLFLSEAYQRAGDSREAERMRRRARWVNFDLSPLKR